LNKIYSTKKQKKIKYRQVIKISICSTLYSLSKPSIGLLAYAWYSFFEENIINNLRKGTTHTHTGLAKVSFVGNFI
jgi:hypothetical protein